jgi:hypothetical protein
MLPYRRGASCRGASRNCFILWSFPVGANLSFCERFHRNCLCIVVCRRLGVGVTPFRCGDALCMNVSFVVMCGVLFKVVCGRDGYASPLQVWGCQTCERPSVPPVRCGASCAHPVIKTPACRKVQAGPPVSRHPVRQTSNGAEMRTAMQTDRLKLGAMESRSLGCSMHFLGKSHPLRSCAE